MYNKKIIDKNITPDKISILPWNNTTYFKRFDIANVWLFRLLFASEDYEQFAIVIWDYWELLVFGGNSLLQNTDGNVET